MVCRQCGKYFEEDVAICDECGAEQAIPDGKVAVTYRNNQVVYVEHPVISNIVSINENSKKKKTIDDRKFNLYFSSFLVATICMVFYFVIYPNMNVTFDSSTQYRSSNDSFTSSSWISGEFMLDGVYYRLGDPYSKFLSNNWKYDEEEYDFLEDFILEVNEKYPSEIKLISKKYTSHIKVGFINKNTSEKDINKCHIWSITIDNIDNDMEVPFLLPGNIKNNSTTQDVFKIYNELDKNDIIRDDINKYTILKYHNDNTILDLYITDDKGLEKIIFQRV